MAEIRTVTTLTSKREEIERAIVGYERRLAQARADLAHINAAITIFNTRDSMEDMAAYVDIHRVWKRGHLIALCKGFLKAEGPLDTTELTKRAMTEAGLDTGDKVLAKSIAFKIIHAMRQQRLRGTIKEVERRKGRCVWALPG